MGRLMAIDYGKRRIGVAMTDEGQLLASPLTTIDVKKVPSAEQAIADLVNTHAIECLIVGWPRNMDGSEGFMSEAVEVFVEALEPLITCPVEYVDERLTSRIASQQLRETGKKAKQQKGLLDQQAACLLLEDYLRQ